MSDQEKVMYDSDEAATYKTGISGWVSRDGRFWGNNEHMARWSGCTHKGCEDCGEPTPRGFIRCRSCTDKKDHEKFLAMPKKEWDGETPLYSNNNDQWFFDLDSLCDYLADTDQSVDDLDLVICSPVRIRLLDEDYFLEDLHEGAEVSSEVYSLIGQINEAIKRMPPESWEPSGYRLDDKSLAKARGE